MVHTNRDETKTGSKTWINRGGVAIDRWNIQESGTSRPEDRPGEWIFQWVDQVHPRYPASPDIGIRTIHTNRISPNCRTISTDVALISRGKSRPENEGEKKKKKRRSGRRFQTHRLDDEANQVTAVGVTCDAILNPTRGVSWKRVSNETKLSVPRIFKRGRIISLSRNQ